MTIASWSLATSYLYGLYKLILLVTVLHGIAKHDIAKDMANMCVNLYISVQLTNKFLSRLNV